MANSRKSLEGRFLLIILCDKGTIVFFLLIHSESGILDYNRKHLSIAWQCVEFPLAQQKFYQELVLAVKTMMFFA